MGKINLARVFLGGLLAGLIINIFEYILNGDVFAPQWAAFEKALGLQMRHGAIPLFIVFDFVAGIDVVCLYIVARPHLGAGPNTSPPTAAPYGLFAYTNSPPDHL